MSRRFFVLLLAINVGRAQNSPALERLSSQRWVDIKSARKAALFEPPKKNAIADKWSLSQENITTEIAEAYRYKDNIVVFGWSGNTVGVVTVIDASTGKERLQLLVDERNRFITGSGSLLFGHWFVKDAYKRDDSLWLLDLKYPLPAPDSQLPNGIVVEIGTKIYPGPGNTAVRHSLRDVLIGANGQELFLTDWPITETQSFQVCFIRIDLVQLHEEKTQRNCVDGTKLSGYPLSDIKSSRLEFDPSGVLRFSLTFVRESAANERFVIDPVTLATSKSSDKIPNGDTDREGTPPLLVPWDVEKLSLARGSAIDLQQPIFVGHEQERLAVDLSIGEAGAVIDVSVTGSSAEVRQRIEAILRTWWFKPTFLNGRATKVRVHIESSPESLFKKS